MVAVKKTPTGTAAAIVSKIARTHPGKVINSLHWFEFGTTHHRMAPSDRYVNIPLDIEPPSREVRPNWKERPERESLTGKQWRSPIQSARFRPARQGGPATALAPQCLRMPFAPARNAAILPDLLHKFAAHLEIYQQVGSDGSDRSLAGEILVFTKAFESRQPSRGSRP